LRTFFAIIILLWGMPLFADDASVLNWNDCVHQAEINNPDLAASVENIQQYKADKWIAKSPFLPQVLVNSSANKSDSFTNVRDRNRYDYSVRGEQLIFDGLKVYNDVKSAKEDIRAAEYDHILVSSDILYSLREAFANLLKAQTLVPIMQEIIARRSQNLKMIRLTYESGREHEGSLLLAQADLKQAEFDLRKAHRDISVAQYALRKAMGWNNNTLVRVRGEFKLSPANRLEPSLQWLANQHPQLKRVKAERDAAKFGVDSAKAEFFPEVSVNAEAGKVNVGISGENDGWQVGIGATWPIFEGGRNIANTQKAKARFREALSNLRSQDDTLLSTLEYAWQNLQDATEEVSVRKSYLDAARVRAKISRAQYANGLLIFDNWIIIEDSFINAQKSYVNTQANMLIAEAAWVKAKGGALDHE